MSLFICSECRGIENTNLMTEGLNKDDKDHPNLTRMEMDGIYGDSDEQGEVRYICSECNTGHRHNEFPKLYPTEAEELLASYSERNAITPLDHPDGCVADDYDNYYVDERYQLFVELFGKDVNKDNNVLFKIYLEDRNNFDMSCLHQLQRGYYSKCNIDQYIYNQITKELIGYVKVIDTVTTVHDLKDNLVSHVNVFDYSMNKAIGHILTGKHDVNIDIVDELLPGDYVTCTDDVAMNMAIRDSQIYKSKSKSITFRNYGVEGSSNRLNMLMSSMGMSLASMGIDPSAVMSFTKHESKPHWKEVQPITDKDRMLAKAQTA